MDEKNIDETVNINSPKLKVVKTFESNYEKGKDTNLTYSIDMYNERKDSIAKNIVLKDISDISDIDKNSIKVTDENGEHSFEFSNFVPYIFLYDDRGVCVSGGYVVDKDPGVQIKENMNVVEFRGLEKGRYTLKLGSYVYTDWPKVYRLLEEKTIDFTGEQDEMVEFGRYVVIKK